MTKPEHNQEDRIRIGITQGDINGIGYEVIIKTLADNRIIENNIAIVYGVSKVASYHRKAVDVPAEFTFNLIKSADVAHPKRANIINVFDKEVKIDLGQSTENGGYMALLSLKAAIQDIRENKIDVLVTAPINKYNIQSEDFNFPGHTEYLAQHFGIDKYLMLMVSNGLRIGVATGHVSLKNVAKMITEELIMEKLRIMNDSLIKDFNIRKPKIAVLGLNPHAGDRGLIGEEEQKVIIPTIQKAFAEGIMAFGPYPADGFFGNSEYTKFDGVLAMYHDQGLIPFKTLSFKHGVNFTAGLPIIRTSPAHGTAYELAGKNIASHDSFREAMYLACDIYKNRKLYEELTVKPLPFSNLDKE